MLHTQIHYSWYGHMDEDEILNLAEAHVLNYTISLKEVIFSVKIDFFQLILLLINCLHNSKATLSLKSYILQIHNAANILSM